MNRTQLEGRYQKITGLLKSRLASLTGDDRQNLAGKRDQLLGTLRERFGVVKDDAEKQIDKLIALVKPPPNETSAPATPTATSQA